MTNNINEQISALLDNELSPREANHTLDMLEEDSTLRRNWDRYHLIGDAMRGEAMRISAESIADRVRVQLDSEPTPFSANRPIPISRSPRYRPRWIRSAGGAALAASVAVVTVLSFPELTQNNPEKPMPMVAEQPAPTPSPYLIHSSTHWKNLSERKVESKLNRYLIDHNEYTSPGGIGVIPYTSFVSYDSNR